MSTSVNGGGQDGVYGAVPANEIRFVFRMLEDNMRHRRAETIKVMTVFSYVLLNAREGGSVKGQIPEDLQFAFDIVSGLHYTTESHQEYDETFAIKSLLSLNLGRDTYLEIFREELRRHAELFFDKSGGSTITVRTRPQTDVRFGAEISSYGAFLRTLLGLEGKRVLDFDARFTIGEDLSGYGRYRIVEENKYFRAFFILRKHLEGWGNVSVSDRFDDLQGETFDVVRFSCDNKDRGPVHDEVLRRMESDRKAIFIYQRTSFSIHRDLPRAYLDQVISLLAYRRFVWDVFVLRPDRHSRVPVTFVDGKGYWFSGVPLGRQELQEKFMNYYPGILSAVNEGDPRFVIYVRPDKLSPSSLLPFYYLFREKLRGRGSVPLYTVLFPAEKTPCSFRDRNEEEPVLTITDENIRDDDQVREIVPEMPRRFVVRGFTVSSPVLLIGRRAGLFNPDGEKEVVIGDGILPFVVREDRADRRYLVKYLNDIASELPDYPDDYLSLQKFLECIYLPDLTVDEQRAVVENHLRAIADDVMKGIEVRDVGYQVLVVTSEKDSFNDVFGPQLDRQGFKVLDYVERLPDLESILRACRGEGVPASRMADAVIADAGMDPMSIQRVMYEVRGFGIPLFFCADGPSPDREEPHPELGFLSSKFKEMLVVGHDALCTVKKRLNEASGDYLERYADFFAAARRFDDEYPNWGLGRYAAGVLSRKPFHLDLREFRTKIDKYIGGYLRDRGVVPADPALFEDGAIPDLLYRPPYEDRDHGIKVSLFENLDRKTRGKEAWLRSAYVTIRKLCNVPAHSADFRPHTSVEEAAFSLFMEVVKWLDRVEVRERYGSGKVRLVVERLSGEGRKGPGSGRPDDAPPLDAPRNNG